MKKIIIVEEEEKAGDWDLRFGKGEGRAKARSKICPVCSAEIEKEAPVFECPFCGNIMHVRCIQPWIEERGTCPICRRPLSESFQRHGGEGA